MAPANANLVPGTGNPRAAAMARSQTDSCWVFQETEDISIQVLVPPLPGCKGVANKGLDWDSLRKNVKFLGGHCYWGAITQSIMNYHELSSFLRLTSSSKMEVIPWGLSTSVLPF